MEKNHNGFTLLELLLVTVLIPLIIGMLAFMFQTVLESWTAQSARIGLVVDSRRAARTIIADLRNADAVASLHGNEIRFASGGSSSSVYYLYNDSDSYPVTFSQASYDLKKATLSGGIAGTFVYGSGELVARNVLPPPETNLSVNGSLASFDIKQQQGSSVTRSMGLIKPRNM